MPRPAGRKAWGRGTGKGRAVQRLAPALVLGAAGAPVSAGKGNDLNRQARDRRDRRILLAVTVASALAIAIVLYFAGAFTRSTG